MNSGRPRPLLLDILPDVVAFAAGLVMAWAFNWQTRDLVWTLWLASIVVGYAIILWNIFGPLLARVRELSENGTPLAAQAGIGGAYLVGALFLLVFFTVHFGGFHLVHSVFLNLFFPVNPGERPGFPEIDLYLTVAANYWPFVLVAFVAERGAFKSIRQISAAANAPDTSVKAAAVNRRLAANTAKPGGDMFAAYKNVIRLHLLIFFFAFASFAKLENFAVYTVVYAVYFFPWRVLRGNKAAAVAA